MGNVKALVTLLLTQLNDYKLGVVLIRATTDSREVRKICDELLEAQRTTIDRIDTICEEGVN